MPDRFSRPPAYRLHKARGTAVVTIDGKCHYLGPYGSAASHEKYARIIAEWKAGCAARNASQSANRSDLTVVELCAAYWEHATAYYVKDGKPTDHLHVVKQGLRVLRELYGRELATSVGPLALRAIQAKLVDAGRARTYINDLIGIIRRVYRWAVTEELVPVAVYQALIAVPGLKLGRTKAREPKPIGPVDEDRIEATLPHLPVVVADMVRLQRLLGCRPGEVCGMRPCDIDTSGELWTYQPARHKTEHHGRQRVILIGPKAQDVLRPYLLRPHDAFCFSPADNERKRHESQREARKTRVQPSQQNRRKRHPKRQVADRYNKDAFNRSIRRACNKAWPAPEDLTDQQKREWENAHSWSANQLRHAAATEIRKRFGLEAAQVILGHAKADVTQVYAERDLTLAAKVMQEVG